MRSEDQGASLTYEAVTVQDKGQLQQLGINRRDDHEPALSVIKTQGNYCVANCKTVASECQYVKCVVKLSRKKDDGSYTPALVLSDYLTGIKVGNTEVTLVEGNTECIFVINKNTLSFANEIYNIPIEVTVLSGDAFENGTDSDGNKRVYSNYKVTLEVTMQTDGNVNTAAGIGTYATDYLIYTHAKIFTGRVTP